MCLHDAGGPLYPKIGKATDSGIERPIDGIVADICIHRQSGEKDQTKDWLRYVADYLGDSAANEGIRQLKEGCLVNLYDMKTAFGGSLISEEQNIFDLGFDSSSLENKVVRRLRDGSEAADQILWH